MTLAVDSAGSHKLHFAGTIGHVAHGKSTVVKAISGVQTVRFKNELERNITIKLGYANAKVYRCQNPRCPRLICFRALDGLAACRCMCAVQEARLNVALSAQVWA